VTRTDRLTRTRDIDTALRRRAERVIPGGMYGHLSVNHLAPEHPQFYSRSQGSRVWDVDGNEYVDLMCSFGPGHPRPSAPGGRSSRRRFNLREAIRRRGRAHAWSSWRSCWSIGVAHADWAMFAKSGSEREHGVPHDRRAATGRQSVLAARGAYHGSARGSTPVLPGVTPGRPRLGRLLRLQRPGRAWRKPWSGLMVRWPR